MLTQPFNPKEYADLKRRVEALRSRVTLDVGPEQKQAERLLVKMEKKLLAYEKAYNIPREEPKFTNTSTNRDFWDYFWDTIAHGYAPPSDIQMNPLDFMEDTTYHEETRTIDELIRDLGVLFAIFGSTYQTVLNYHVYKIRFLKQLDKRGEAFYRVSANIYEDDIQICKGINIGFWPAHYGDDTCGDMEFSLPEYYCSTKYNNGCPHIYIKLLEGLKDIWNQYFADQNLPPMLTEHTSTILEKSNNPQSHFTPQQRQQLIEQVEKDITTNRLKTLETQAYKMLVGAYEPFATLLDFLENSGVVYKVEKSGVYIWNNHLKRCGKLVGYHYLEDLRQYSLYLF